jgi:hypothetical protein
VYTTVGTKEKQDFIKKQYPQVFGQPSWLLKRAPHSSSRSQNGP